MKLLVLHRQPAQVNSRPPSVKRSPQHGITWTAESYDQEDVVPDERPLQRLHTLILPVICASRHHFTKWDERQLKDVVIEDHVASLSCGRSKNVSQPVGIQNDATISYQLLQSRDVTQFESLCES